MRKFILIPEYAPLYAMKKCFGPTHGPLTKPTPTPVDIIGQLLLQTGKEKVTIYEVIPEGANVYPSVRGMRFSDPVQLTVSNYRLPYEEICGKKPDAGVKITMIDPAKPEPVFPVHHGDTGATTAEAAKEMFVERVKAPEAPVEPPVEGDIEAPVVETTSNTEITEPVSETAAEELVDEMKPVEDEETPAETISAEEPSEEESVVEEPEAMIEEKLEEAEPTGDSKPADEIDWSKLTKAERKRLRRELGMNNPQQNEQ